jgi:hypothetical protein
LLPPNSSSFHPGANGEFSHYVWTAPFDGTFSLSATFSPFDMGGTDVHILENGAQIFEGEVSPGVPQSFNPLLPLVLLSGATLDFAVGRGIDGTFYYDTTGIAATISTGGSVPDGGMTVSMFGLGLAGIAFLRRKFA